MKSSKDCINYSSNRYFCLDAHECLFIVFIFMFIMRFDSFIVRSYAILWLVNGWINRLR